MLEPQNNEALKIETARRRTGLIRQYPRLGSGRGRSLQAISGGRFAPCSKNDQIELRL